MYAVRLVKLTLLFIVCPVCNSRVSVLYTSLIFPYGSNVSYCALTGKGLSTSVYNICYVTSCTYNMYGLLGVYIIPGWCNRNWVYNTVTFPFVCCCNNIYCHSLYRKGAEYCIRSPITFPEKFLQG